MNESNSTGNPSMVALGAVVALVLLTASVWVSGMSTSSSLAVTALLILIAVGVLAASNQSRRVTSTESADEQRRRMGETVP